MVYVHGGGWQRGSRRDPPPLLGADFYDQIAAQGLAVAAVDYRLSGEARFPAPLEDVCAAVGWVRDHAAAYGLDADRVCPVGRLGRRPSRAAGRADRARGAGCGGLVPGHRPGGHAVRPGGRGRRTRSGAGLPRGAAPRRARLVRARPGPAGQPGEPRPGRRAADPAAARDGGRPGAGRAERPAGRGAGPGRGGRRAGTHARRDALLEGRGRRGRDHPALDRVPARARLRPGRWPGGRRARARCPGRRCARRARCAAAARPAPAAGHRARRRPSRRPRRSARPRPR